MATTIQVVFDCSDPDRLARFWAAALHYKVQDPPEGFSSWHEALKAWNVPEDQWNSASAVVDPEGKGPRIYLQQVDTPKTGKNRVHLDVHAAGARDLPEDERRSRIYAEVERLTALGAVQVRVGEERGDYWIVMQDPEGNEFCVL
jgi:glyoxalase superfamily protein